MRQYRKKSVSDKPERDDRIKLQLINFNVRAVLIVWPGKAVDSLVDSLSKGGKPKL